MNGKETRLGFMMLLLVLSSRAVFGTPPFSNDDPMDGESGTGFTDGGQVNFGDHYHLLFSAGRDFSWPDLLTGYLAMQLTF